MSGLHKDIHDDSDELGKMAEDHSTWAHNCLLYPCWWNTDIAANANAPQLVPSLCATREAQQPVGYQEAYYNSNRRLDILNAACQ